MRNNGSGWEKQVSRVGICTKEQDGLRGRIPVSVMVDGWMDKQSV